MTKTCPTCMGTGSLSFNYDPDQNTSDLNLPANARSSTCPTCSGSGQVNFESTEYKEKQSNA